MMQRRILMTDYFKGLGIKLPWHILRKYFSTCVEKLGKTQKSKAKQRVETRT
jgi:hypothetical protein